MAVDEEREIEVVVRRIADRFPDVDTEDVHAQVLAELEEFGDAHVRDFVPVLVENAVMDTLRASMDPEPLASDGED